MTPDTWDQALSLPFLILLGVVAAGFLPMLYSMWETYLQNEEKPTSYHNE